MVKKIFLFTLTLFLIVPAWLEAEETPGEPVQEEIPRPLDVDAARRRILEEDPAELTSLTIGDTDVSLEIHGFWNPSLSITWGVSHTPFGLGVASTGSFFLLEQEVDLTLALWIRERWFVEANFQDDNPLNTYRAGYQGLENEFVEYAGIGNTGLDFPLFPYLDLGGDAKSSAGFYGRFDGRFNGGPVKIHALARYDAATVGESVFTGSHERTVFYTTVDSMIRGRYYRLPDERNTVVPQVYLEDTDGWREANPSEAAVSARLGIVELAASPKGRVAVYYPGGYDKTETFFTQAEAFFSPFDLNIYAPGQSFALSSYIISIQGKPALLLYEEGFFSPFEAQNRYMPPTSGVEEAAVVSSADDIRVAGYDMVNEGDESGEEPFLLTRSGASDERWPFAQTDDFYKRMYLGDRVGVPEDLRIRWTSFAQASGYYIGEDVLPGSVTVFRGGLRDMAFSFNASTGEVVLHNPARANETIRVTYLRNSAEKRFGSIVAGLGFVHETDRLFSWALGLGLRWNAAEDAFSEYGQSNAGRIGAGAKLEWQGKTVQAAVTLGAGYEENDTTGLYRAAGMEGNELTWNLSESGAIQANPPSNMPELSLANRADLVYRRYRSANVVGLESLADISANIPVEDGLDGPYAAQDKALRSEVLVAEAKLDASRPWAGYQIPLDFLKETLIGARGIEIPFHLYAFDAAALNNLSVFVQFGPMPKEEGSAGENAALLVEAKLYDGGTGASVLDSANCGLVELLLTNDDRRKLRGATHLRLVVKLKNPAAGSADGRVLLAPLIIRGAKFAPIARNGADTGFDAPAFDSVSAIETYDMSLRQSHKTEIDRLHPGNAVQRVLQVSVAKGSSGKAGADGLVPRLPFENYRSLTFFFESADRAAGGAGNRRFLCFSGGRQPGGVRRLYHPGGNPVVRDGSWRVAKSYVVLWPGEAGNPYRRQKNSRQSGLP
jgi:hypothetical protein